LDDAGNILKVGVRSVIAALGAAAACAAASGCTTNVGTHTAPATAKVSKADLQKDISNRVAEAGQVAQSVACPGDLVGEAGKTTRCTVIKSATSSYEVLVTVSSVEGSNVNYDVIPVMSKTQLESAISQQLAHDTRAPVDLVVCKSGLDGKVGAVAHCLVTAGGVTGPRAVQVTSVSGFGMSFIVVPVLLKDAAAGSLLAQLGQAGPRPDSASCADDLNGFPGNTVECTTVTGGRTQTFILTVTGVTGTNITYRYDLKP
jgi:Domain of unknown function (DUF4333)